MSVENKNHSLGFKESNQHSTLPPTSMISVVEEQSADSDMPHIMPELTHNINNISENENRTSLNPNNNAKTISNSNIDNINHSNVDRKQREDSLNEIVNSNTLKPTNDLDNDNNNTNNNNSTNTDNNNSNNNNNGNNDNINNNTNNNNTNNNNANNNNTNNNNNKFLLNNQSKPSLSILAEDSINPLFKSDKQDLLHKKSVDQINDIKLKKASHPSLSSLRQAVPSQNIQNNNFPTISSASTTLTKGSTRAEYFAAKLHDAIKSDPKIQDETVETFVYDTTTKTPPVDQNTDNTDNSNNINPNVINDPKSINQANTEFTTASTMSINDNGNEKNNRNNKTKLSDNNDHAINNNSTSNNDTLNTMNTNTTTTTNNNNNRDTIKENKLQSMFNPSDSPVSYRTLEDNFDVKSRSSRCSSRKPSRRRSFKSLHNQIDQSNIQPFSRIDNANNNNNNNANSSNTDNKSVNQLRQITSRLFDSKLVQPRRYSGIDSEFINNDSFDDEIDYYDPIIPNNNILLNNHSNGNSNLNYNLYKNNNHQNNNLTNNQPYDYLMHEQDYADDDEELSSYFSPNYNGSICNNNNPNYLNKQQILGNISNIPDYGSVNTDNKRLFRKKNDLYNSPHDFTSVRAQKLKQIKNFCYTISAIFLLLFLGFISGFILATNKELQNLKVSTISNTIISQEELVFDMEFSAFNPGLMPISIDTVQLDVFAKTNSLSSQSLSKSYETVLLGAINSLEVPLYFQGGFLNRQKDISKTEIKIINPCSYDDDKGGNGGSDNDDDDNNNNPHKGRSNSTEMILKKKDNNNALGILKSMKPISHTPDPRWLNISRNPFDLIVRGAMIYKLPFSSQNHTISISYTSYIDPGSDYLLEESF